MKICTKCGLEKDQDDFFANKSSLDGRMACCKQCKTALIYAWRAKNKDRWNDYVRSRSKLPAVAEQRKAYRSSDAGKAAARANEQRPEVRAKRKAYRDANPARWILYGATKRSKPAFKVYQTQWRKKNVGLVRFWARNKQAKRRAMERSGSVTLPQWDAIVARHGRRCFYCNKKTSSLAMDHYVPLARGGLHDPENVVPACKPCNSRKWALTPEQFATRMGRLCW